MPRVVITIARPVAIIVTVVRRPVIAARRGKPPSAIRWEPTETVRRRAPRERHRFGAGIPAMGATWIATMTGSVASDLVTLRAGCDGGHNLYLYSICGLGWRRSDLVRRRTKDQDLRRSGARDGRHLPTRPALSLSQRRGCPKSACETAGWASRRSARRPHNRAVGGDDLCFRWKRWRFEDGGLVPIAGVRRPVLRGCQSGRRCSLGTLLARSPVLKTVGA